MALHPVAKIILTFVYLVSLYFVVFWFLVWFDNNTPGYKKKKLKELPFITIGVPIYNEARKGLKKSIESLLALDYPKDKIEILAVNHGSTDDTPKILEKFKDKIKIINISRTPRDMKGVPTNVALKRAKGEFFVTFDADSLIEPDALHKLLPYFTSKKVGAVLPILKLWKKDTLLQKMQHYEFLVNAFYKKIMGKKNSIPVAPGPFSVYRTAVLREVGGFDPYGLTDDFEVTIKVQKAHYEVIQTSECSVYSNLPGTLKEVYNQRNRWYLGSLRDVKKHRDVLFNKRFGDYGMMTMPMIPIAGVMAILILGVTIYGTLKNWGSTMSNLSSIGFDIFTLVRNFSFNVIVWDLNFVNILIGIIMFSITGFFLYSAHRHMREGLEKHSIFSLPAFLLFFFFILGVCWTGAVFDFLRVKKRKWR